MNKAWVDVRSKCLSKKTEVIEAEELLLTLLPLLRILFSPVPFPYIHLQSCLSSWPGFSSHSPAHYCIPIGPYP